MKKLFLKLFFAFFLLATNYIQAQYTDVINSNKPGFSESPYSVGTGIYQFESHLFFRDTSTESIYSKPQAYGADLLFRTSFFLEKLELNTQITYQNNETNINSTSDDFTSGLSKFTFGAKYLVYQPKYTDKTKEIRSWKRRYAFDYKRLIPSVAIYVGQNTDLINEIDQTKSVTVSPKVGLLLQQNLTTNFNIISNVYYNKIGTDFSEISYIVTATQNFNNRWSAFLENQGIFQEYQNTMNFGSGLAYLFNKNLQINTSARFLKEGESQGYYAGFGVSYRMDKHHDSYTELDEHGKKLTETPITRENEKNSGFFSKIFKKKNKKKSIKRRTRKKATTKKNKSGVFGLFGKKKKKEKTAI